LPRFRTTVLSDWIMRSHEDQQNRLAAASTETYVAGQGPTGPRSAEGKAVSSGNSLKHGLASGRLIVPGEDPADFDALLAGLLAEHSPATETEQLLVQHMAQSWWLMQRAIRYQNDAFTEMHIDAYKLALFLRYQTTHERAFYKALNTLVKLQNERRKSDPVGAMHAAPVSQNRRSTRTPNEFVSQKPPQPLTEAEFVSQNGSVGALELTRRS